MRILHYLVQHSNGNGNGNNCCQTHNLSKNFDLTLVIVLTSEKSKALHRLQCS